VTCQRQLLIHFLGFVLSLVVVGLCRGEQPSQFRRACLVGNTSIELESALKKRGFLITKGTLADCALNTPHHAFNLIYYRGRVEQDGDKWNFSGEEIVIGDLVDNLQQDNIARFNVILFDLLNEDDDVRKFLRSPLNGLASRGGTNRGGLAVINKSASEEDSLAKMLTSWMLDPKTDLRSLFSNSAYVSVEPVEPIVLHGIPASAISPANRLIKGGSAGDQWIAPDGMNFIWCPPGKYTMGDAAFIDTQPVAVTIDKGFWISKFELTRFDIARMNVGFSNQSGNDPMHPAGAIRIEMLLEPLHKKIAAPGWSYDLPTEAEWEYAARAGSTRSLPSPIDQLGQHANFADLSLFNAREEVHFIFAHQEINDGYAHGFRHIGRYLPNTWGIHDMFGNASELCAGYYTEQIGSVNYRLKTSRDRGIAVLRGGSWCSPVSNLHVAYRTGYNGDETMPYAGARLVIRQGNRVTRTYAELVAEKKAEEEAARANK
jgi:formylglycine-generating enzyme required for sulfatase activity